MGIKTFFSVLFFSVLNILTSVVEAQTTTQLKDINTVLEQAFDNDQNVRDSSIMILEKHGVFSSEYKNALLRMNEQDSINQSIVFPILDKYGWLGNAKVSHKACNAFFYVIQHAGLASQIKYSQKVKEAFHLRYINPYEYSIFVDRLNIKQNKYQIYGSQTEFDQSGNTFLYPVLDIKHLDKQLKKLGLKPKYKELEKDFQLLNVKEKDKVVMVWVKDKTMTKPIANVNLYVNGKFVGKTDDKGFFQGKLKKIKFPFTLYVVYNNKKIKQMPSTDEDFYKFYFGL